MLDFEIGGLTPFKFIVSTFSDTSMWSLIIGALIIFALLRLLYNMGLFHGIGSLICFVIKSVKKIIYASWFIIAQSYMMLMFYRDSKENNYNSAEYWPTRRLTIEGIKAIDSTGTQPLLIKHVKIVNYILLGILVPKRICGNIIYRISMITKP